MRVCYWGTYDSDYPRNIIIISGLKKAGVEVIECHERIWQDTAEKMKKATSGWLDIKLILRLLKVYILLIKRYFGISNKVDAIIVGYSGHFDMFVAKIISILTRKHLVFDAFLSLYDSLVFDRKVIKKDSLKARLLYFVDKYACRLADKVLLDTNEHIKYFCNTFHLQEDKFYRIFIGANDAVFYPRDMISNKDKNKFIVLHFGKYIPLHGLPYIIHAAKELEKYQDILFRFIGSGDEYDAIVELANKLKVSNVEFIKFVPPTELVNYIAEADVCLGIFGDTDKAARVIPNKVYECFAMKKPVITGNSPAAAELLVHEDTCLLCNMADSSQISNAILRLKHDDKLKEKIAENGYKLFKSYASPEVLGRAVKSILEEL